MRWQSIANSPYLADCAAVGLQANMLAHLCLLLNQRRRSTVIVAPFAAFNNTGTQGKQLVDQIKSLKGLA
jgi:hypothetical protein